MIVYINEGHGEEDHAASHAYPGLSASTTRHRAGARHFLAPCVL